MFLEKILLNPECARENANTCAVVSNPAPCGPPMGKLSSSIAITSPLLVRYSGFLVDYLVRESFQTQDGPSVLLIRQAIVLPFCKIKQYTHPLSEIVLLTSPFDLYSKYSRSTSSSAAVRIINFPCAEDKNIRRSNEVLSVGTLCI